MQRTHYNSDFKKQKHSVTLVCDNINNAPNIGSLFRIADAFNIEEIIFCGDAIPIGRRMTKTSRSTEKHVSHQIVDKIEDVVEQLTKTHTIIGLEITENSIELSQFKLQSDQPIALIIGDENFGVSESVLKRCDSVVHINMYGNNSSMNVVQATSIALYEIVNQLHTL
ncbi:TrmH family RNA methyltransferase [Winogradskyella tangerina]|uniref:TrmH family RNA methyltransferase n=1 Tax=Winogradskyella tangerina TaxID=2023240 RepID=UPI000DBE0A5A|nr:TrmH family RNA methyltransferase [Winogradskyella tangerina]